MDKEDILQYFGYVMLNFLFYTGVRFSEMQALTLTCPDTR